MNKVTVIFLHVSSPEVRIAECIQVSIADRSGVVLVDRSNTGVAIGAGACDKVIVGKSHSTC